MKSPTAMPQGDFMIAARTAARNEKRAAKGGAVGIFPLKVARLTGLEPATPGVTGRYSNQLSYNRAGRAIFMVVVARLTGLEPATPGVTGRYSNQLSYNRADHLWIAIQSAWGLRSPMRGVKWQDPVLRRILCHGGMASEKGRRGAPLLPLGRIPPVQRRTEAVSKSGSACNSSLVKLVRKNQSSSILVRTSASVPSSTCLAPIPRKPPISAR